VFDQSDPNALKKRRARAVASAIHQAALQFREQSAIESVDPADPQVQQAGMEVFQAIEAQYRRLRDDDLQANLDALSGITQDESADPIARFAAEQRQNLYYEWQDQMAATQGAPMGAGGPGTGGGPEMMGAGPMMG
jgi:hypothetical protein